MPRRESTGRSHFSVASAGGGNKLIRERRRKPPVTKTAGNRPTRKKVDNDASRSEGPREDREEAQRGDGGTELRDRRSRIPTRQDGHRGFGLDRPNPRREGVDRREGGPALGQFQPLLRGPEQQLQGLFQIRLGARLREG